MTRLSRKAETKLDISREVGRERRGVYLVVPINRGVALHVYVNILAVSLVHLYIYLPIKGIIIY